MKLERFDANPLLGPEDLAPTDQGLEVLCTLNPAVVRFNGEILLMVRVGQRPVPVQGYVSYLCYDAETDRSEVRRISMDDPDLEIRDGRGYYYRDKMVLSSLSHLHIARSTDGRNFTFDPKPAITPTTRYEAFGCEDARITFINDRYYITYTAVSEHGVTVMTAHTEDFVTFTKTGLAFPPYQKDVVIFPRQIGGKYVCRHRPYSNEFNDPCIWTAWSPDLRAWGDHEMTLAPIPNSWACERVGCGGTPIETPEGWLEIFHGANKQGQYHLGAMLSDLENPHIVLAHSTDPVLQPEAPYELHGVFSSCVFTNGLLVDDDGTLTVYYGAADRVCAGAVSTVDDMLAAARK
ncbi:MAG: glycosidase [Phycisphaerales bacterium]|nr:glycosidase [Phycisphaerales bacterium]